MQANDLRTLSNSFTDTRKMRGALPSYPASTTIPSIKATLEDKHLDSPLIETSWFMGDSSRRRPRGSSQSRETTGDGVFEEKKTTNDLPDGDYYDDESAEHDKRMYGSACSFGQFVLNPCLCLYLSGKACFRRFQLAVRNARKLPLSNQRIPKDTRRYIYKWNFVEIFFLMGTAVFGFTTLYTGLYACEKLLPSDLLFLDHRTRPHVERFWSEASADPTSLRIPSLDFDQPNFDVGGWNFYHKFHLPSETINRTKESDFGTLEFVGPMGVARTTRQDELGELEKHWKAFHPDKAHMHRSQMFADDIADVRSACQRQNWIHTYNPSCNDMHGIDLAFNYNPDQAGLGDDQLMDSFYINHGYYRDVWVVHQVQQDLKTILKTTRWKHDLDIKAMMYVLKDALVMERLTKSPRIVDIWGHCGTSVWVEALPYEVEEVVVPGTGFIKQKDLHDEFELNPQNDFTAEQKLDMAIQMAKSIADLHGFEDGLIVHDDVQLCQWLRTREGPLKMGDFNRAEMPNFNPRTGAYCKYNNGGAYGNYRSPEEFAGDDLDEKIDVFSFGNNIYGLLTGLWVFYENEDDEVVHKKLVAGTLPFVDPRYRKRSFIENKLVEVMQKCWVYEPKDRISIFEALALLEQAQRDAEKMPADTPGE